MNSFRVIPAIDIMGGKCVRLTQGSYSRKTIYKTDPETVAKQFLDNGFDFVHVVDLDGAKTGKPVNLISVEKISATGITIELGGGLRNQDHLMQAMDAGASDLIIGTKLLDLETVISDWITMFPGHLIAGIDAKNGMVAVQGWEKISIITAIELIKKIEEMGFSKLIYTDIEKDGVLAGPNIKEIKKIANATSIPLIASGGVSSMEDIEKIKSISNQNIRGVIVGKAIYENKLSLAALRSC